MRIHIRVHSLCCRVLWILPNTKQHVYNIMIVQKNVPVLKIPCTPPSHSLTLLPDLWQPLIFLQSLVVAFPECHIVNIIQYKTFSYCLISLSNTLSSMTFPSLIAYFFLLLSKIPLCGCVCVCGVCMLSHSVMSDSLRPPELWLMNYSLPGSSAHGIFQARILEWGAISHSRGPSQPRDGTCISCVSCIERWVLYQQHDLRSPVWMYDGSSTH